MKQLFLLLLSFSLGFSQNYYLNVKLRDGTQAQYLINDITKIDFSGITNIKDIQKINNIVKTFKLINNFPNPFNNSTSIEYEIPTSGNTKVQVFDLNGRLVKVLLNKKQNSGLHRVLWDGTNKNGKSVASGLYIYTIQFNSKILSQKMIFLK